MALSSMVLQTFHPQIAEAEPVLVTENKKTAAVIIESQQYYSHNFRGSQADKTTDKLRQKAIFQKNRPDQSNKKNLQVFNLQAIKNGAPGRIRTVDQLIKSQLLYRLSYGGVIDKCILYSLQVHNQDK